MSLVAMRLFENSITTKYHTKYEIYSNFKLILMVHLDSRALKEPLLKI